MEMILHSAEKMPDSPKRCGRTIKPETEHIAARHQGISSTTFFHIILCCIILYYIVLYYVILYYIVLCYTILYYFLFCIILYYFMLYIFFVLYSSILSISILYSIVLYSFKCFVTEAQISYHVVFLLLRFIGIHYFKG